MPAIGMPEKMARCDANVLSPLTAWSPCNAVEAESWTKIVMGLQAVAKAGPQNGAVEPSRAVDANVITLEELLTEKKLTRAAGAADANAAKSQEYPWRLHSADAESSTEPLIHLDAPTRAADAADPWGMCRRASGIRGVAMPMASMPVPMATTNAKDNSVADAKEDDDNADDDNRLSKSIPPPMPHVNNAEKEESAGEDVNSPDEVKLRKLYIYAMPTNP